MSALTDLLYNASEWSTLLALLVVLLLAGVVGDRIGRRVRLLPSDLVRAQIISIQGALVGLFALLLGFTFSMALARYDARRQLVVKEANAIGTAALRAALLHPGQRATMTQLLRRYIDIRLAAANSSTMSRKGLDVQAGLIQDTLWVNAAAAAEVDPRSVPFMLLFQALNALIDAKGENDAELANRVPGSGLGLLIVFALLTTGVLGYVNGLAAGQSRGTATILTVLIALVILVILDLDRPDRGMIRVSQESLIRVQQRMEALK